MNNKEEIDALVKSLDRVSRSRDYYWVAKGLYKNPYWVPEREPIIENLCIAIGDNQTFVWSAYRQPYKCNNLEFVQSWLHPPYPKILPDSPGMTVLQETIQLRVTVSKSMTWTDDYSVEDVDLIIKHMKEENND